MSRPASAPVRLVDPRPAGRAPGPAGSTTERIVESITNAIIERRLPPGTKLAEQQIADLFSVSRTVVRQALNQLSRDRLVTLEPARGAFVASPSVEEARQVYDEELRALGILCRNPDKLQTAQYPPNDKFPSDSHQRVVDKLTMLVQRVYDSLARSFNRMTAHVLAGLAPSWIGPRPEEVSLARRYATHVPFYHYRHAVRPGISGWAAVHQGNVGDVEAAELKLQYDFYYIRHFSPAMDFLIALRTVKTVMNGFGSR